MIQFQFILTVEGRGGKFNLKNTILNIGSGNEIKMFAFFIYPTLDDFH